MIDGNIYTRMVLIVVIIIVTVESIRVNVESIITIRIIPNKPCISVEFHFTRKLMGIFEIFAGRNRPFDKTKHGCYYSHEYYRRQLYPAQITQMWYEE